MRYQTFMVVESLVRDDSIARDGIGRPIRSEMVRVEASDNSMGERLHFSVPLDQQPNIGSQVRVTIEVDHWDTPNDGFGQ